MKKVICILISALLIFSVIPVLGAEAEMVVNGGFEGLAADGKPTGWSVSGGNFGTEFNISAIAKEGKNSLQIKAEANAYAGQVIKGLVAGKNYKLTAYLKIISAGGGAGIKFQFKKADGKYLEEKVERTMYYKDSKKGEWQQVEYSFTCPEGAASADLLLRLFGGGEIYWDNVTMIGETSSPVASTVSAKPFVESSDNGEFVVNGDFEKIQAKNNMPLAWNGTGGELGVNILNDKDAYGGSNALKIKGEASMYAIQRIEGLVEGETYRFTAWLKFSKSQGSAGLKFAFKNKEGKYTGEELTSNTFKDYNNNKWQQVTYEFNVPKGAVASDVLLRLFEGGEIIWDNVSVKGPEAVPLQTCEIKEPVEGAKNLFENGDFENVGSGGLECYGNKWGEVFTVVDDKDRGGKVLKVESAEQTNPWVRFKVLNVMQTAEYQVSAWLKTNSVIGEGAAIKAEFYTGSTVGGENSVMVTQATSPVFAQTKGTWQKVAAQFVIPEGTYMAAFYIRLFSAGEVYWDDAECYITKTASHMSTFGDVFPYTEWEKAYMRASANESAYETPKDSVFKFELLDGEKVLDTYSATAGKDVMYEYNVSLLQVQGKEYIIKISFLDKDGNIIAVVNEPVYRYDRPKHLNEDGLFINHDGKAVHPVIGYHVFPEDYEKAAKAGINVVQSYVLSNNIPKLLEMLDTAKANGIMVLVVLYPDMAPAAHPKNIEKTKACVEAVKNHPAVFGYMVQDEPGLKNNSEMYGLLKLSYKTIRDMDPNHVVYICECEKGWYVKSGNCSDVLAIDPYPGSQGAKMAKHISTASEFAREATQNKKPIYNIVQVFKWQNYDPSSNDVRHMLYQALFTGNLGLGYFDVNDFSGADSAGNDLWDRECFTGVKSFYENEYEDAMKAFVTGEYATFAEDTDKDAKAWYKLFVKGNDIYAVLINRESEDVAVNIPLTSTDKTVTVGNFKAVAADISGAANITGAGTLTVNLKANQVVRYKLTVSEDLSGLTTSKYKDIYKFSWAKKEIDTVSNKGIVNSTSLNSFSPGTNITRAEFAYFLVRTLGLKSDSTENFTDVDKGAYYAKELSAGKSLGILKGVGDNKFNPYDEISRQDLMTIIARAMKLTGDIDLSAFSDSNSISEYASESIKAMIKSGLVKGNADGTLNPTGKATRAEAAVIMYRILNFEQ